MPGEGLVRAGRRVSIASIGWTTLSSAAAITLGALSGSVVLATFGLVGVFDAAGSAILVGHFGHALRHETISADKERTAHLVVSGGLLAVGVATAVVSTIRLIQAAHSKESFAGTIVAATSIVVLGYLAYRKRSLGRTIPSRALVADGVLSLAGCLTAVATVVGTRLAGGLGWWWVDPVAALCIAAGAIAFGLIGVRGLVARR